MTSACALLLLTLGSFRPSLALYEEHAGLFDWHVENIGKVTRSATVGSRVYVTTDENIIAGLDSKKGRLVWRQILEPEEVVLSIHYYNKNVFTLSYPNTLRVWSSRDGSLRWSDSSFNSNKSFSHLSFPFRRTQISKLVRPDAKFPAPASAVVVRGGEGSVAILRGSEVKLYELKGDMQVVWNTALDGKGLVLSATKGHILVLGEKTDGTLATWTIDIASGKASVAKHPELPVPNSQDVVGPTKNGFAFLNPSTLTFYHILANGKSREINLKSHLSPIGVSIKSKADSDLVLISSGAKSIGVSVRGDLEIKVELAGENGAIYAVANGGPSEAVVSAVISTSEDSITVEVYDIEGGRHTLAKSAKLGAGHGPAVYVMAQYLKKSGRYRALVVSGVGSLIGVYEGRVSWIREEALASVVGAQILPLPLPTFSGNGEDAPLEFPGPITRLIAQIKSLRDSLVPGVSGNSEGNLLISDYFGLRKIVTCVTKYGRAYGISTTKGKIIWTSSLPCPFDGGACEWSQVAELSPAVFVTAAKNTKGPGGLIAAVYATSGEVHSYRVLKSHVTSISRLPLFVDPGATSWRLSGESSSLPVGVAKRGKAKLLLALLEVENIMPVIYTQYVDIKEATVSGFAARAPEYHREHIWSITFSKDIETISDVAFKSSEDIVHSAVIGVGDGRIPRRKYLNPSLLAVGTDRKGVNGGESAACLYLIDGVTGKIINRFDQKNGQGPIHLALSENSVVMHYFNQKSNSYEITVVELYEHPKRAAKIDALSPVREDGAPTFSSLTAPGPEIMQKTFLFSESVRGLSVTSTRRGITSKLVLASLSSHQLAGIGRHLLDARRPHTEGALSKNQMADGLLAYHPVVVLDPKGFPTYNKTVANIKAVASADTFLESTTLVLAYGTDLFFARVTPSGAFDLLSSDFNRPFLTATVTLVAVLLGLTYRWSRQKKLDVLWT
ncbi:hypothetical protein AAMO2058_001288000 [Amorphochlora amoebiformis]